MSSCASNADNSSSPTAPATATPAADITAGLPVLTGKAVVQLIVNDGTITLEIDGDNAPVTAGNFVDLVNRGVYNGLVFHRVVREPQPFVVQGGDPQSASPSTPPQQLGTGSFIDPDTQQPRYIPLEITPANGTEPLYSQTFESAGIQDSPELQHLRGAVAMARSQLVDSASSQFYITLSDLSFLDGNYAVFGYVTEGMDIVDQIQQGDRITSAEVIEGLEGLQPGS